MVWELLAPMLSMGATSCSCVPPGGGPAYQFATLFFGTLDDLPNMTNMPEFR